MDLIYCCDAVRIPGAPNPKHFPLSLITYSIRKCTLRFMKSDWCSQIMLPFLIFSFTGNVKISFVLTPTPTFLCSYDRYFLPNPDKHLSAFLIQLVKIFCIPGWENSLEEHVIFSVIFSVITENTLREHYTCSYFYYLVNSNVLSIFLTQKQTLCLGYFLKRKRHNPNTEKYII